MGAADETIRKLRAAVEAADVDAVMETMAPDIVLTSPITGRFKFQGHEELRELMEAVLATLEEVRYYEELGDDRSRALFYTARIGSQQLEEASLIRLDEQGLIQEFTLWFRPLPGLTRLTASLAPRLTRRRSRAKAALVAAAAGLLAFLASTGDGALARLVRPDRRR